MSQFNFSRVKEMADKAIEDDMYKKAKYMYPDIELSVKFNPNESNFSFTGLTHQQVEALMQNLKQQG